jgi:excinuclease ABC subunit B
MGRAARNVDGRVVMYADTVTDSMRTAINETQRRRAIQEEYNRTNGITPQSIVKQIDDVMSSVYEHDYVTPAAVADGTERFHTQAQLDAYLAARQTEMRAAAANLDFEKAAAIRDEIKRLRNPELGLPRTARGA